MEMVLEDRMFIETREILKYLSTELYNKIPENVRKAINEYDAKSDYEFTYDFSKSLIEQDISNQTKDFIGLLHYLYWCTAEEKEQLDIILTENEEKERQKYFSHKVFQNNSSNAYAENNGQCTQMTIVKEDNFIIRIINKIKSLFKR